MKIGLVIAGGIAKGAYQAGFLKALKEELGETNEIVAISCASIGMLSSYALSADKVDLLSEMWSKIHFESMPDIIYNVWHNNFLKQIIYELTDPTDELKIPIYAPILMFPLVHASWSKMEGKYHKKWPKFMLGGMSYPVVAGGIHFWRGQIALDGGGIDCIPILPLLYHEKCDLIMVCHFYAEFKPRRNYLQMGTPIIEYDISLGSPYKKHSFDFHGDTLTARIQDGYKYGKKICSELFARGRNDLKTVLEVAERHHQEEFFARLNYATFENWIQMLNNILYPLLFANRPTKIHKFKYPLTKEEKEAKKKSKKATKALKAAPLGAATQSDSEAEVALAHTASNSPPLQDKNDYAEEKTREFAEASSSV